MQWTIWFRPKSALLLVVPLLLIASSFFVHSQRSAAEPAFDLPEQAAGRLSYGTSVTGSVNPSSPVAFYSFDGTEGDLVNVQVVGMTPNMTPTVSLLDNTQARLSNNNNDVFSPITGDASLSYFLPYTGLYLLVVNDVNGQAVDFVLRLDGRPHVVSPTLEPNVAVRVDIPANSPEQFFLFEHQETCDTTLTIVPETAEFAFTAHVRSETGQSVGILRGGALTENRFTIPPNSGMYEIEVGLANRDVGGFVVLLITCAADAPFCDTAADLGPVDIVLQGGTIGGTPAPVPTNPPVVPTLPPPVVVTDPPPIVTLPPAVTITETPTEVPQQNDCGGFALTSPREGLPNGGITVYWNPAPSATNYQASVINNDNGMSTGGSTGAGTTSLGLDVSNGTLGEGFSFTVLVVALSGDTVICRDAVNMFREAPRDEPDVPDDPQRGEEPEVPLCNGNGQCDGNETGELCPNECNFKP